MKNLPRLIRQLSLVNSLLKNSDYRHCERSEAIPVSYKLISYRLLRRKNAPRNDL